MTTTSQARVHKTFKTCLDDLKQQAAEQEKGFRREGQRTWNIPSGLTATTLFDVPNLHKGAFDREEANTNYNQLFASADSMGTTGDVIALKQQIEYMAAAERAFRFRHASACRNITHAMGRRQAQGQGATFSYIENSVGRTIKTGAVG